MKKPQNPTVNYLASTELKTCEGVDSWTYSHEKSKSIAQELFNFPNIWSSLTQHLSIDRGDNTSGEIHSVTKTYKYFLAF